MTTIQEEILDSFYAKLGESEEIDEQMIQALRALFESEKKLKADDFAAIFAREAKASIP